MTDERKKDERLHGDAMHRLTRFYERRVLHSLNVALSGTVFEDESRYGILLEHLDHMDKRLDKQRASVDGAAAVMAAATAPQVKPLLPSTNLHTNPLVNKLFAFMHFFIPVLWFSLSVMISFLTTSRLCLLMLTRTCCGAR